jgi:GH15 family glucan-1,4-alpha-glucosidase
MDVSFDLPTSGHYKPISGYGVIGNTRTAALVGYDGSIDWCCFPRFDSPSVFAAVLDWRKGGRWAIQPLGPAASKQTYLQYTNILRTEFESSNARVTLTDFMPCSKSGKTYSVLPEIHRIVACDDGEMEMKFVFQPAFDYGRSRPRLVDTEAGVSAIKGRFEMALSWSNPLEVGSNSVKTKFRIVKGEKRTFVLSYGEGTPRRTADYRTGAQLAKTEAYWRRWASSLKVEGWRDAVIRSALALKLLTYSPTGAVVAAATTSLPEVLGGQRNWDYRFSWIRDSANSLRAFNVLGSDSEAESYLRWLIESNPALEVDLRLMYDVNGGTDLTERVLEHLEGYKGSKPVRVGNAASEQLQFDSFGYMLDAIYFTTGRGRRLTSDTYFRFVKPLAEHIAATWDRPSHGIWEGREPPKHYIYMKAWAYVGLDRAIRIARATRHPADVPRWRAVRDKIKEEVLRKGWNGQKKSFAMHYGTGRLDSANLMLPLMGFISPKDVRMVSTIRAIQDKLADGPFVYRTPGHRAGRRREGAFFLCSFWLVSCLAAIGDVETAEKYFSQLVGCSNHLGLYSEEIDPVTKEALGNFPQAFSHLGLILAVNNLERGINRQRKKGTQVLTVSGG